VNLLVIDDAESMREMVLALFERKGHAVRVAENGREGLRRALEEPPDVIVCDHDMPEMNGTEVFLALPEALRARFILWTGGAAPGFPDQSKILRKPCAASELLERIAALVPVPKCPRCGEPARVVIGRNAYVRCVLNDDGTPGKALSAAKWTNEVVAYECGGGHVWNGVMLVI
jgi:CheY-like chemotaxis protein